MRISVKVKPRSGRISVQKAGDMDYIVAVKSAAAEGKANEDLINALAEYFAVPRYLVSIVAGHKSRRKIIDIGEVSPG